MKRWRKLFNFMELKPNTLSTDARKEETFNYTQQS